MNQQQVRDQLLQKRGELLERLQALGGSVQHREAPLDPDLGEQAIELENLDVLFCLDETSRHELNQVNNALKRMEHSEYEFCTLCGEQIGEERLKALPYTDVCRSCAY
jgi:DnaK suppressor protein